ncbi:uncharacterized protein LAJ45_11259 [Morchella importuna]|uniref:uncharacterized protein n=1 Tax=Morchella importuna TaxID=1174673 RepID=UPI001E8E6F6D|nr:uncharacterized protein LAJ45_11259 [Morchella importuna]KAH8144758.1 hypothetical protein LAJ45_11259 [Morchella importuna]
MRFSAILLSAGFVALAAAQSSSTTTSAAPNPTTICLNACDTGDVTCQASCVGVPAPDASMVNATNECAAACPQGNGTAAETDAFSKCVQSCITNEFLSTSAGAGATATGTGTGTAATGSGSSQTATGTGSSASASGTSASDSAAAGYTVTGSFIALFAVAAGIIVL